MSNFSENIHSLTDFKRNSTDFVRQIKTTKQPVFLTVTENADLVIQDAESYQELLETAELVRNSKRMQIDNKLMEDAIKETGLTTEQEVIELALKTLIKIKQQEKIKAYRGKLKWEGDLQEMRTNP